MAQWLSVRLGIDESPVRDSEEALCCVFEYDKYLLLSTGLTQIDRKSPVMTENC